MDLTQWHWEQKAEIYMDNRLQQFEQYSLVFLQDLYHETKLKDVITL